MTNNGMCDDKDRSEAERQLHDAITNHEDAIKEL